MAEKPEWVRYEGPGDSVFVDITRLTDGRVMCCLCFDYKAREDLHEVEPGVVTDVCEECWALDQVQLAARLLH